MRLLPRRSPSPRTAVHPAFLAHFPRPYDQRSTFRSGGPCVAPKLATLQYRDEWCCRRNSKLSRNEHEMSIQGSRITGVLTDGISAHGKRKSRASCVGRGWPPPHEGLSALVDLGMSDEQLAFYFCVELQCLKQYREKFGIGPNGDTSLRSEFRDAEPFVVSACPRLRPNLRMNSAAIPPRPAAQYDRNSL